MCVSLSVLLFFPTQGHSMRKAARMPLSPGSENPGQPVNSLPLWHLSYVNSQKAWRGGRRRRWEKVSWMLEHCC